MVNVTSGSPQSAAIGTTFAPLVVTVLDTASNPFNGAVVTFVAPATGASGTFPGGATTATATSGANGQASVTFSANEMAGGPYIVWATIPEGVTPAVFNLTNLVGPPASITATSGTPQSAAVNTEFLAPMVATVLDVGGNQVTGAVVTFTAPAAGASGAFLAGQNTATTNTSGVATSAMFRPNGIAGGPYEVLATVAGVATPAVFTLTNMAAGASKNYSFYLSGLESARFGQDSYGLAGSVTIDVNGNVLGGEQDYKDDWKAASPQPSGDTIMGGELTVNASTGLGTLSLITNNGDWGTNGIETLGVQFVNINHALIIQFDGSATSSGSLDLQTLPSTLEGSFSFTLLGTDSEDWGAVAGGVFSISGTSLTNGIYDFDDTGTGTFFTGAAFSGTISAPDSFGRGTITITNTELPAAINYYIVGPEVLRIIVVGPGYRSGTGSAFGQGASAGNFSNTSLGNSVFGVESNANLESYLYAATGMFTTNPGAGTFQGIADEDEEGAFTIGSSISGTYNIASNGYGNLVIVPGELGGVSYLGIYMTDPSLNLIDPNNTSSGLGGALVAGLDQLVNGTGVIIPQTDTSTSSFAGPYAFGIHLYSGWGQAGWEVDFLGQGSVTDGVFTGDGFTSDPSLFYYNTNTTNNPRATFSGTIVPDLTHVGRYTMPSSGLTVTVNTTETYNFKTIAIYQANGGQLFWMDEELMTLFLGTFQQQGSLAGLPGAK
jgi:hypothetical protein